MSIDALFAAPEVRTLVDELLSEQRELSAVAKFSRAHDFHRTDPAGLRHRDLIPLSAPRPGEQYGFEVDLDRCSGCKGCVTACHALNGLDESESWREVGLLLGEIQVPVSAQPGAGNRVIPWQQTVTTACHHCVEPACLLGCPVLAYDKDPLTGIVRHLDDQCIGCSYCILKCPYEVPRYSAKRGIVRKCDMCHGRLAVGEAPACVQACPNEAIRITNINSEWATIQWRGLPRSDWLPDAPEPGYTLPATRYLTKTERPYFAAADHYRNRAANPHWPLILMLTLSQVGMGGMLAAWFGASLPTIGLEHSRANLAGFAGFCLFVIGLLASVFHLGQPRKAWRVWLGWRTSWMSREAIALNSTLGVAATTAFMATIPLGAIWPIRAEPNAGGWSPIFFLLLRLVLASSVVAAVATQVMVYVDTRRAYWSWSQTGPRFFGTLIMATVLASQWITEWPAATAMAAAALLIKLALEIRVLKHGASDAIYRNELQRSALLITGPLRLLFGLRLILGVLSLGSLLFGSNARLSSAAAHLLAGASFVGGEIVERWLFFAAVSPNKMPGHP